MAKLGRMDAFAEELGDGGNSRGESKGMADGEWECTRCGYVREGRGRPRVCPECGADGDEFEFYEFEDDEDWEDEDWD